MRTTLMPAPKALPQSRQRPFETARYIPRSRQFTGVKKSFIGSGVRYDLAMAPTGDAKKDKVNRQYMRELITDHVSGRLKVAPEHTSDQVLQCMRKPSFEQFRQFKRIFDKVNEEAGLRQQLIPYFISSHPACHEEQMAELAAITKQLDFHLEQVQDFTPTPMTVATEIYYSGYHPYTGERVYTARSEKEKLAQRQFFFWWKPDTRQSIVNELRKMHRPDLIQSLYGNKAFASKESGQFNKDKKQDSRESSKVSRDKRNKKSSNQKYKKTKP